MVKQEIVWVFGQSAAGKASFIEAVTKQAAVRHALGWTDRVVAPCTVSLTYVAQSFYDAIREKRVQILDEAPVLLQTHDIVLIKWQYEDSTSGRIAKLQQLLPDAYHRIILLSLSHEENAARMYTKPWWDESWDIKTFIDEEIHTINIFLDKTALPVTIVDSSAHGNYQIIKNQSRLH